MKRIWLIRHGKTKGNLERRYVGRTDEDLLLEAAEDLKKLILPKAGKVYVSPLKRCKQTAEILFPGAMQIEIPEYRECDFGEYEYCNYEELKDLPPYQKFLDTMGEQEFPGGEDKSSFQKRCLEGFIKMLEMEKEETCDIFMVVHGGTIMAILDQVAVPHRSYYDWQAENGRGFIIAYEGTMSCNLCGIFDGSDAWRSTVDVASGLRNRENH